MTNQHIRLPRIGKILLAVGLTTPPAFAGPDGPVAISAGAQSMLARTLGTGAQPAEPGGGRPLFEAVLASEAFRRGDVGPFQVHVLVGTGGPAGQDAEKIRDRVVATLGAASNLVAKLWPAGGDGLISAARFPVVLVSDRSDYLQLLELVDHCERAGYSGWAPARALDTPATRSLEFAQTWEVLLMDLSHATIAADRDGWLKHGAGTYCLTFVVHRALCKGAWGRIPPWLSAGLIDELDISAYGKAWVGQDTWTSSSAGSSRSGWTAFVPAGCPPPTPPPKTAAGAVTTVQKTGEPWLARDASETRHWKQLVSELKSQSPIRFAEATDTEGLLPRDRAAARCLLHLLLLGAGGGPALTAQLDRAAGTPPDGMPDSEPLTVIFARALGGDPEVDRLESLDTRALLTELGRQDLIDRLEQAGASEALALKDHRAQSAWLYEKPAFDSATRERLFQTFLAIEYLQERAEWKALGPHLDSGLAAALRSCGSFPTTERKVAIVTRAFLVGLLNSFGQPVADPSQTKARGPHARK